MRIVKIERNSSWRWFVSLFRPRESIDSVDDIIVTVQRKDGKRQAVSIYWGISLGVLEPEMFLEYVKNRVEGRSQFDSVGVEQLEKRKADEQLDNLVTVCVGKEL